MLHNGENSLRAPHKNPTALRAPHNTQANKVIDKHSIGVLAVEQGDLHRRLPRVLWGTRDSHGILLTPDPRTWDNGHYPMCGGQGSREYPSDLSCPVSTRGRRLSIALFDRKYTDTMLVNYFICLRVVRRSEGCWPVLCGARRLLARCAALGGCWRRCGARRLGYKKKSPKIFFGALPGEGRN